VQSLKHCMRKLVALIYFMLLSSVLSLSLRSHRVFPARRAGVGALSRSFGNSRLLMKEKSSAELAEEGFTYDPKKIRNFSIIAHIGG